MKLEHSAVKSSASKLKFRTKAFIDGKFVNATSGKTYVSVNPATGKPLAKIASCDSADVDQAVKAARRSFEKGRLGQTLPGRTQAGALHFANLLEKNLGELASAGLPRCRQTHRRLPDHGRAGYGALFPLARRGDRQGIREGRPHRAGQCRADCPRTAGRGGRHPALEFPHSDGRLEARPHPGDGQQRGGQAGAADLPERSAPGRNRRRSRHSRRRAERRPRQWRRHRRRAVPSTWTWTRSPSPARPRWAGSSSNYSAESNLKRVVLELGGKNPQVVLGRCGRPRLYRAASRQLRVLEHG